MAPLQTNVATKSVFLTAEQSTVSHVLVNELHIKKADMRKYGKALEIWVAAKNEIKNFKNVYGTIDIPKNKEELLKAVAEVNKPTLEQRDAFEQGRQVWRKDHGLPVTTIGAVEPGNSNIGVSASRSNAAINNLTPWQKVPDEIKNNLTTIGAGLNNCLTADDYQKVIQSRIGMLPALLAWSSKQSPAQLDLLKDALKANIRQNYRSLITPKQADTYADAVIKGLKAFADLSFSDKQLKSIENIFTDKVRQSIGLSSDAKVINSNSGTPPPKDGGLYAETSANDKCRQFTVFVPAQTDAAKMEAVKNDLIAKINAKNSGYQAVDGGTNVINITLKGVDKARIYPYLNARFDITPQDVVVAVKSSKGNDNPLVQEGAKFHEVKNPQDFKNFFDNNLNEIMSHKAVITTSSALFTNDEVDDLITGCIYDLLFNGKTVAVVSGRKLEDLEKLQTALKQWAIKNQKEQLSEEQLRHLIYGANNCAYIGDAAAASQNN
ncbi:MAG: hypothetical protein JW841_10035 [Deltaproteobacteria bacterium]|nr:hypothetical protein [Deltaproteobacteria bacterium]